MRHELPAAVGDKRAEQRRHCREDHVLDHIAGQQPALDARVNGRAVGVNAP
jgi:hypothetical protein